jgi:uncharacterized protein (DUF302 family)
METVFQRESGVGFDETVEALKASAAAHKWGVLGGYAFDEILASKGFPQTERFVSIDICAAAHANAVLAKQPLAGLCMPCAVLAYSQAGKVHVAAVRPSAALPQMFGDASAITETLAAVDAELEAILSSALA